MVLGKIKQAFTIKNGMLMAGGVIGSMLDSTVDRQTDRFPKMARVPLKMIIGTLLLPMGAIGQGAGVVTLANAGNDLVGKVKTSAKN